MGAVPAGVTFTALSAGAAFGAAIDADGNVYGWGANESGQLGNGTRTSSWVAAGVSLAGIRAGLTPAWLAAGAAHVLVLAEGTPALLARLNQTTPATTVSVIAP